MPDLTPGTVVTGPFICTGPSRDDEYYQGVGVIMRRSNRFPYNVGEGYVPVKILIGDRASGGYDPESLTPRTDLKWVSK